MAQGKQRPDRAPRAKEGPRIALVSADPHRNAQACLLLHGQVRVGN